MKGLQIVFILAFAGWMCAFCAFIVMPNLLVSTAQAQMPFGEGDLARWQLDQPVDSEGVAGEGEVHAGVSRVRRAGYTGPDAQPPSGVPLRGPIQHWSGTYEKPLLGCRFRDANYASHTGVDLPVNSGTPVYATLGGQVVWAGDNGAWGLLVVIENGDYQIWLAHNETLSVREGDLVQAGQVVAASDNSGNSSGPHVHYGIKHFKDPADLTGAWLNPELFFSAEAVMPIGCGR
jgi:murein DD-endopeptidase MepM/ murein hydrolase activator NlpD